jgi:GTP-binding protein LepA
LSPGGQSARAGNQRQPFRLSALACRSVGSNGVTLTVAATFVGTRTGPVASAYRQMDGLSHRRIESKQLRQYHRRGDRMDQSKIRNFSIIAHIDHGKSTLADRVLELTDAVSAREMREQLLDTMDLERERGITIKAQAVRVTWKGYELNLIDTPGHVDFTYEVSRSLQACEGAMLVVDAAQGIEAQTLANAYLAIENDLEIVPVVNKIDLPAADPDGVATQVADLIGEAPERVVRISAKTGENVADVLDAIVERVPPPAGDPQAPPRALVFDSSYDQYRGVVAFVRVVDGSFRRREPLRTMATRTRFEAEELGFFSPTMTAVETLEAGEVGYVVTGLKDVSRLRVGDTLTSEARTATEPVPGYKDVKPMVFAGLFPTESDDYPQLRDALERLKLNDAALVYEPETSQALGFGFRCGFLGLLHMEIVRERLEREFDLDLLVTAPNVAYRVLERNGEWREVHNPAEFPREADEVEEPYIKASVIVPKEYVGIVMELCNERRGRYDHLEYLSPERVHLTYELPLAEIVLDFYDQLKSRTRGYASFDYDVAGFKSGNLVRVDILVGGEVVDALSLIVHRDFAYDRARSLVERLGEEIPRQMFDVAIQAAIGARVIARETVKAKRKDVLAKCYGGDITRKRKLLEKQKAGKKRMKQVGAVEVPQEAFLAVLNIGQGGRS